MQEKKTVVKTTGYYIIIMIRFEAYLPTQLDHGKEREKGKSMAT
jgi:hypothetical protein